MEYEHSHRRAIAMLIDMFLLIPVYFIVGKFAGDGEVTESLTAIASTLIFIAYMTWVEGTYGQSLGKRVVGIKVIMENGEKCTLKAALIRNLLRIIDALPNLYIVGILVITFTKKRQRIGDLAAKTVVIRI